MPPPQRLCFLHGWQPTRCPRQAQFDTRHRCTHNCGPAHAVLGWELVEARGLGCQRRWSRRCGSRRASNRRQRVDRVEVHVRRVQCGATLLSSFRFCEQHLMNVTYVGRGLVSNPEASEGMKRWRTRINVFGTSIIHNVRRRSIRKTIVKYSYSQ